MAAVERAGVVLHVGFNRRVDPSFSDLAATAGSGRLGRLLELRLLS